MKPVEENETKDEILESPEDEMRNEQENQETATEEKSGLAEEYLNLARVIQADFDNYRKRSLEQIERARVDGIASAVEVLLPSLDAFKKVKESIKDENTLSGIEMLERAIQSSLEKLGVEKIPALGLELDPTVHNALAVISKEGYDDGIIVEEFQAGYRMNDKIIRCSQVLVNKI